MKKCMHKHALKRNKHQPWLQRKETSLRWLPRNMVKLKLSPAAFNSRHFVKLSNWTRNQEREKERDRGSHIGNDGFVCVFERERVGRYPALFPMFFTFWTNILLLHIVDVASMSAVFAATAAFPVVVCSRCIGPMGYSPVVNVFPFVEAFHKKEIWVSLLYVRSRRRQSWCVSSKFVWNFISVPRILGLSGWMEELLKYMLEQWVCHRLFLYDLIINLCDIDCLQTFHFSDTITSSKPN